MYNSITIFPAFLILTLAYVFLFLEDPYHHSQTPSPAADQIPPSPIVSLPIQGQVQGVVSKSRDGQQYLSFWGIPYAKRPRRFEPPEPPDRWSGIRNASIPGSACLQISFGLPVTRQPDVFGSEDCLYLNVFTNQIPSDVSAHDLKPVPVIVYIHGGGLYFGQSDIYGADFFMDEPVVLVTINYRLAALGFLNVGHMNGNETRGAGNMGLMDQLMALKWVQENIAHFGGDKGKVTIYGESAGGVSVHCHMVSPMSRGLFQRAIAGSGSSLASWIFRKDTEAIADDLGKSMGCPTKSSNELIKCLLGKDAKDLMRQTFNSLPDNWRLDPIATYGPSVEIERKGAPPKFFHDDPESLLKHGKFNKVPFMTGFTKNEGILLHSGTILSSEELVSQINSNWSQIGPLTLQLEHQIPASKMDDAIKEIRQFYFGSKPVSIEMAQQLENLYSDQNFIHPIRSGIFQVVSQGGGPVYAYKFDFSDGQNAFGFKFSLPTVIHADDLRYAFSGVVYQVELQTTDKEAVEFSKRFVKTLVHFATHGNLDEASAFDTKWEPLTMDEVNQVVPMQWFHLDSKASMKEESKELEERMQFWDQLLAKYNG